MKPFTTEQKKNVIWAIIEQLHFTAGIQKKPFDVGSTFFSLAFKPDADLQRISKLCGL